MASTSPMLNPTRRRLSSRRSSMSAPDPHNASPSFANPDCASSSRITILRVPPAIVDLLPEPAVSSRRSSWGSARPGSSGGRPGSSGGGNTSSSRSPGPGRLSFAFSSFGPAKPSPSNPGSPNESGGNRPGSPTFNRHRRSSSFSRDHSQPQLTPQQVLELAHSSLSPKPSPSSSPTVPHARLSPYLGPSTSILPAPAPATFLSMSMDEYLPFLDRPSEVHALLSTPPTSRLFILLAQTFPITLRALPPSTTEHDFAADPRAWPLPTLYAYLTTIPREVVPDAEWTRAVRRCVLCRSESIWVRLKGALGVPPELEADSDEESEVEDDPFLSSSSSEGGEAMRGEEGDGDDQEQVEDGVEDNEDTYPPEVILEPIFSPAELLPASGLAGSGGLVAGSAILATSPVDLASSIGSLAEQPAGAPLDSIGESEEPEEVEEQQSPGTPTDGAPPQVLLVPSTPQIDTTPDGPTDPEPEPEPEPEIHALRISTSSAVPEFRATTPTSAPSYSPIIPAQQPVAFAHRSGHRPSSAAEIQRERQRALGEKELVRTPGNPLFVGSFARLDVGPTLHTRQSIHRNSLPSSLSRPGYGFSFSRRVHGAPGPMMGHNYNLRAGTGLGLSGYDADDGGANEYALSLGSGSERSFR